MKFLLLILLFNISLSVYAVEAGSSDDVECEAIVDSGVTDDASGSGGSEGSTGATGT